MADPVIHDPVDPIHADVDDYNRPIAVAVAGGECRAAAPVVPVRVIEAKARYPPGGSPALVRHVKVAVGLAHRAVLFPAPNGHGLAKEAIPSAPPGSGIDRLRCCPNCDLSSAVRLCRCRPCHHSQGTASQTTSVVASRLLPSVANTSDLGERCAGQSSRTNGRTLRGSSSGRPAHCGGAVWQSGAVFSFR